MRVQKNDSGKIISMILDEYGQKFDRCFAQTKSSLEFKELANEFGKEFILPRYDGVLVFSESFSRQWQRQPAIIAHMEKGTSYKDYNT